ncbi:MAG: ABC transporter ATP-binding protein, partial [Bacteroidota bacterium]|nr:ABC transporter ATP-binding protein [Bacteroidota bacterium]
KQALKAYDGTLIVVSHDRDFLDGLVDKMFEFRDGKVREHLGSVQDFLEKRKLENLRELERRFSSVPTETSVEDRDKKEEAQRNFEERKQLSKQERQIKKRIDFLEDTIGKLEDKMKGIEAILAQPREQDDLMELTRTYLECKRDLEAKTEEWYKLHN